MGVGMHIPPRPTSSAAWLEGWEGRLGSLIRETRKDTTRPQMPPGGGGRDASLARPWPERTAWDTGLEWWS